MHIAVQVNYYFFVEVNFMLQVSTAQLVVNIQKSQPFSMPEMDTGTSYLFNQVYRPLVVGDVVKLSDLDFSAFEEEDIKALSDLCDNVFERNNQQADNITSTLRQLAPISMVASYV